MKTINRFLLFAATVLTTGLLTGCEDFLAENPRTIFTVETAFEKSSQVDAAVTSTYKYFANLNSWKYSGYTGNSANLLNGIGTDTMDRNARAGSASTCVSNFASLNSATGLFYSLWNDLYKLAAQANLTMLGAEQVSWSDESAKTYDIAQVKFLRGWAYLRLGECFGGVPIVEEYTETLRRDYVRAPRADVYAFAIQNFEDALGGLPDYPKEDGRVSKGIVYHFLTEAYIALGIETGQTAHYQKAIDYGKKTIALHPMMYKRFGVRANPADKGTGYNGVPNYKPDGNVFYDLFQIGNYNYSEGNTEGLMELIGCTYEQYSELNSWRAFTLFPEPNCCGEAIRDIVYNQEKSAWVESIKKANPSSKISTYPLLNNRLPGGSMSSWLGGGTWAVLVSTDYCDEIVWQGDFADDMRNEQVNRWDPVVLDVDNPDHGKLLRKEDISDPPMLMRVSHKVTMQDGWGWTENNADWYAENFTMSYGRDWHVARSSETWLLLAEAYMRLNDQANAVACINEVRSRAQASFKYSGSIDMYDILDERARELSWEEQRWATYLRLTDGAGKNEYMANNLAKYTMFGHDMGNNNGAPAWTLFPIPFTTINQNTEAELAQNPGW